MKVSIPAYQRYGNDVAKENRGKLHEWGEGLSLSIADDDVELLSVVVEDEYEGRSKTKIKLEDLQQAVDIIKEQYDKLLEQSKKTEQQKLK